VRVCGDISDTTFLELSFDLVDCYDNNDDNRRDDNPKESAIVVFSIKLIRFECSARIMRLPINLRPEISQSRLSLLSGSSSTILWQRPVRFVDTKERERERERE